MFFRRYRNSNKESDNETNHDFRVSHTFAYTAKEDGEADFEVDFDGADNRTHVSDTLFRRFISYKPGTARRDEIQKHKTMQNQGKKDDIAKKDIEADEDTLDDIIGEEHPEFSRFRGARTNRN